MPDELVADLRRLPDRRLELVVDAAQEAASGSETAEPLKSAYNRIAELGQDVLLERLERACLRSLISKQVQVR